MSSSSSSEWYSSSSEEDAIMHNMIMNAAQVFMAADEGSSQRLTRRAKYNRDQEAGHDKLVADYFADEPVYPAEIFRRRFRMSRPLFLRIAGDMALSNPFFTLRNDARGQRGFSNLQKCTSAIRQLAYGFAPDALDEYIRMSERTARRWYTHTRDGHKNRFLPDSSGPDPYPVPVPTRLIVEPVPGSKNP
ncbi:uncharacterized protein LOC118486569 [Helianthus annuus]|uniref:uncharacterized protein LOC118486569 n=1 Tax=Helianthus annuus TaxID=4232 RepID=UPI0016531597|nr:uncharacterized protein LOC118486569 [Helianthus annuus]